MAHFAGAFPVLPGKEAALKQFSKDIHTRKKEFAKSEKRVGVKKETWFLQASSQGQWVVVYFETKDLAKTMSDFAKSTDPFDIWYRDQVKQITGVDMAAPPAGPMPEEILSFGY